MISDDFNRVEKSCKMSKKYLWISCKPEVGVVWWVDVIMGKWLVHVLVDTQSAIGILMIMMSMTWCYDDGMMILWWYHDDDDYDVDRS